MTRTHNEAIIIFQAGNIDMAWEVAKNDEGMHEGVTKEAWISFASRCVETQSQVDRAYSSSMEA